MRFLISCLIFACALPAMAQQLDLEQIVKQHVMRSYDALAKSAEALDQSAASDCAPTGTALGQAYHDAFDAWVAVSHLRFGPSEAGNRAFALAFWPDPRSKRPKALGALLRDQDMAGLSPEAFDNVSIAARGFYALERLLFDRGFGPADNPAYHCALTRAVAHDIALLTGGIAADWHGGYADLMMQPGNDTYRSDNEVTRQFYTALATGLEFTADARLGRPLGSFDRPRPKRAEARRSARSLRHVVLSLRSTRELAAMLSANDPEIDAAFAKALVRAEALNDPDFAGVADPRKRIRIEALQQDINDIRTILAQQLGPQLGITAGFNSLDGD